MSGWEEGGEEGGDREGVGEGEGEVHGKAFEFHSRAVKHVMRVRSDGCCRGFFFFKKRKTGRESGGMAVEDEGKQVGDW